MILTDYYDILLQGIDSRSTVSKLVHGVSWTAAVLSDGSCGVAMHTTGETVPRMFDTLIGRPLKEAAGAVLSWNMEEASEALAAVNAFYNRPDCAFLQPEAKTLDGVDLAGKRVGMIGHMIGHSNITAELLALTGSAAINKTLPRLLELSRRAQVILTGPSVSCCPALTELGIDRLNGRVITRAEPMLQAIVEKRMSVNPWSETFQLDRQPLPAQGTETERC